MCVHNYLIGGYREDGVSLFLEVHSNRKTGNGHKLEHGKFQLGKKIFTMKVVKYWNRLPKEVVVSPSLEVFKALSNLI